MPQGNAQQPEAQSLALRHWPPMNCVPTPLPTFFAPAGSNFGPPTHVLPLPPVVPVLVVPVLVVPVFVPPVLVLPLLELPVFVVPVLVLPAFVPPALVPPLST
jgi:hypothetical protein